MNHQSKILWLAVLFICLCATNLYSHSGPFDGKAFKGRIAFSSDGNYNDEDDWGAFPIAIAMLHGFGVKGRLAHVDYNNILPENDPRFYREMTESVLGALDRFGIPRDIAFDCQTDLNGAIENIKNAVNASSADNPLYYILAGPMEVPFRGIDKSDPEKRKFVYCISHNVWNDGYASKDLVDHNKRDLIPSGINWIQIRDGNRYLAHPGGVGRKSTPSQWKQYHWLRDSDDENLRWIFSRLEDELRADISDSCMTYFLLTGDEDADLSKVKRLLADKVVPSPRNPRPNIRLEAENFRTLDNCAVEYVNDRRASQRMSVKSVSSGKGQIKTRFDEPYAMGTGIYDIDVRYFDVNNGQYEFALSIQGVQQNQSWRSSGTDNKWTTHTLPNVVVDDGDEISVSAQGDGGARAKLDYVQLNYKGTVSEKMGSDKFSLGSLLDDADAMPGQIIVAGSNPGYLKYNGGGPAFLCGPDNPETFLYEGKLNADGTRSGGKQVEMIARMAAGGVNAFHCQMFRMRRCNFKDEGDDTHSPFLNHDPSMRLNDAVLDQWESWLNLFEAKGIAVHLEFYNDATDVETMGWKLDSRGNLHPDEQRWIEGIVHRFKHHRNILWGIEESCNKLPSSRTKHFKKIGQVIAEADNFNHPIVQSFVVDNDPEGDNHPDGVTPADYVGDPNIRVVTWLHVQPHKDDLEKQHQEYLRFYRISAKDFVVMKNETFHHPRKGASSRRTMWSCAMAGLHSLEAYHHAGGDRMGKNTLKDDGRINAFMEQTECYRMQPHDDLVAGSTKWMLANPGESYIAYTYDYSGSMGVKGIPAGVYDVKWFDTIDGDVANQTDVTVSSGDVAWKKPANMSDEIVLYIKRRN